MKNNILDLLVFSFAICVSLLTLGCTSDQEQQARAESHAKDNTELTDKVAELEASVKEKEDLFGKQAEKIQALEQANLELKSEVEVFRGYFEKKKAADQPDSFSSAIEKMDASALTVLGTPFNEKEQSLYGGKLRVKAYAHGFICVNERGETEIVSLKESGPDLPPHGIVGKVFNKQGGSKVFGNPIEGTLCVLDGEYRLHVFERSVIFWSKDRGTQSALFTGKFRRPNREISRAESFSLILKKIKTDTVFALGTPFNEKEQTLFSGTLRVKAYTRGFVCANDQDEVEVIILKERNPRLAPFGKIERVFKKQGGSRIFGNPIEGEHSIFDDSYRLHVFEKAIIFWSRKKGTQSAIFSSRFR